MFVGFHFKIFNKVVVFFCVHTHTNKQKMNNIELEHCLRTNELTKTFFRGIFPANVLVKLQNIKKGYYIANTSPDTSDFGHWIGLNVTKSTIEVFDSSGILFFKNRYFKQFVKNNESRRLICNKNMIQDPKSNICGYYCLIFALFRAQKKKFYKFVNMFNRSNLKYNDELIIKLFNKHFSFPICYQRSKNLYMCMS